MQSAGFSPVCGVKYFTVCLTSPQCLLLNVCVRRYSFSPALVRNDYQRVMISPGMPR